MHINISVKNFDLRNYHILCSKGKSYEKQVGVGRLPPLAWIGFKELWKNKKQSKKLQLKVDPQNKTKL